MDQRVHMGAEMEEGGAIIAGVGDAASSNQSLRSRSRSRSFTKPSWLLFSIADLDKRMKMMTSNTTKEDNADTFAEQAETYYQKRPQLLSLLQDLYNGYLSLADRYCQALAKHRSLSSIQSLNLVSDEEQLYSSGVDNDSDVESSLSFQPPFPTLIKVEVETDADQIVTDLVIKNVEYEMAIDELNVVEKRWNESSRKIELQKSLLEVLESERLILLNENARLSYKVGALVEENKGLAAESLFMKRKAGELARCVLKLREDHRVCILSRKIEDLQAQMHGLEKRNKEYYEQLVKQEEENKSKTMKLKHHKNGEVTLEDCFQVDEEEDDGGNAITKLWWLGSKGGGNGGGSGRRVSKWWDKVKNFDMLLCGPQSNAAAS